MIRTDIIRPVPDLLRRGAEERGDHVAVSDATREVSYADLWERTANLAGHLRDAGVRHGDAVVLLTSNGVALVESYLAVTRAGGVGVCLSPQTPADDIGFFLEDTSPRAVIVSGAYRKPVADALREQGQDAAVVSVGEGGGGTLALEDLARARPPVPPPDDLRMKEPAWILYTSGTTGRPKGVVLSQHGMLWVAAAGWLPFLDLGPEDYVLCPLPLFHSYPLDFLLAVLAVGGREHIMERFSTEQALRLLHEEPFTMLLGVPTTFSYLAEGHEKSGPAPRGTLRVCVTAGAIMPREIWERTERALGAPVVDAYGATETSTAVTISPLEGTHEPGTGGVPILGFGVRVVEPASGEDVAPGEEGELIVRGPGVMLGYHDRPQETRDALRDGWYRTGDLARVNDVGLVTITGRVKDVIVRGGENVAPAEVEEVVLRHASVADCAVVRKPHEHLGEVPVLFVVVTREEVSTEAFLSWCREQLPAFKVPAEVRFVDEIPKTASGKIMRHRLEALLPAS